MLRTCTSHPQQLDIPWYGSVRLRRLRGDPPELGRGLPPAVPSKFLRICLLLGCGDIAGLIRSESIMINDGVGVLLGAPNMLGLDYGEAYNKTNMFIHDPTVYRR